MSQRKAEAEWRGTAEQRHGSRARRNLVIGVLALLAVVAVLVVLRTVSSRGPVGAPVADVERALAQACSACHAPAPPDILPRATWAHVIGTMYRYAAQRDFTMPVPQEQALAWYQQRAPQRLPAADRPDAGPGAPDWAVTGWRPPAGTGASVPSVGHVRATRLFGGAGLDLLVSDMASGRIYALRPYRDPPDVVEIGAVPQPTRVAVTDLDGDGALDVVAAGVGRMRPTNEPVGSVVWLRRTGPERFEPFTLLDDIGRVGDVTVGDINGNGRTDIAVAVFGWQSNGGLLWLEHTGADSAAPTFRTHVLDGRAGFTDVRIADMDGDGDADIVALVTQEHQQVLVYWRDAGAFRSDVVYAAPHPDWGLVGLEVVDFTGNGRPDIVIANGDNLDITVAKPQHGVALLENMGAGRFEYRHLTHMYGAHRAEPVDLLGDGRLGLLVSAYLPAHLNFGRPDPPEAVIWLERVGPTQLVRRVLSAQPPMHMTLTAGDMTGDGNVDFAIGWMDLGFADTLQAHRGAPLTQWVSLWRNVGAVRTPEPAPSAALIDWARPARAAERSTRRRRQRVRTSARSRSSTPAAHAATRRRQRRGAP